jgi:hypothetical protein
MTTVQAGTGAVSSTTWKNAPTHTINAGGVEFAYRQLGPRTGVPVVFLTPASSPGWFDDEPAMLAGARCL